MKRRVDTKQDPYENNKINNDGQYYKKQKKMEVETKHNNTTNDKLLKQQEDSIIINIDAIQTEYEHGNNGSSSSDSDGGTTVTPRSDTMSNSEGEESAKSDTMSVDGEEENTNSDIDNNKIDNNSSSDNDDMKQDKSAANVAQAKSLKLNAKTNKSIGVMFLKSKPEEKKRFNLSAKKNTNGVLGNSVSSIWPAICLDLYTINYLKEEYFEKNAQLNNLCNYTIPLGFMKLTNPEIIPVYYRIYKQLPLRYCIRLSVFRWMANMIKARIINMNNNTIKMSLRQGMPNNKNHQAKNHKQKDEKHMKHVTDDELLNNMYVKWAIEMKIFLDKIFTDIPPEKYENPDNMFANNNSKMETFINNLRATHSVKTRFKFSDFGKNILGSGSSSFQPSMPHAIIPNIQCSLASNNLFCQEKDQYLSSKNNALLEQQKKSQRPECVYLHEKEKSTSNDPLGAFPFDLQELKLVRHNILSHLAGWPEGAAMFGLHQLFGTNENKYFQAVVGKILIFVNRMINRYNNINIIRNNNNNYNNKNAKNINNNGRSSSSSSSTIAIINSTTNTSSNIKNNNSIDGKIERLDSPKSKTSNSMSIEEEEGEGAEVDKDFEKIMMKDDKRGEEGDDDFYGDVDDELYDWMNDIFSDENEKDGKQQKRASKVVELENAESLERMKLQASVLKSGNDNIRDDDKNVPNHNNKKSSKQQFLSTSNNTSFLNHIYHINAKMDKGNSNNNNDNNMMMMMKKVSEQADEHNQVGDENAKYDEEKKNDKKKRSKKKEQKNKEKNLLNAKKKNSMEFFDIEMQRNEADTDELLVFAEDEKSFFFSCFYPDATVCDFFYVFCSCCWPCVILDIRQKLYGNTKQWFSCTLFNFFLFIGRWIFFVFYLIVFITPILIGFGNPYDNNRDKSVERRDRIMKSCLYFIPLGSLIIATILTIYRNKYKAKRGEKKVSNCRNFITSCCCTTCTISQMYYDTREW